MGTAAKIDTAMVLAAGFGKRLRPITLQTPKPLVPVAGRPMLDRTLEKAAKAGIDRAVINVHYLGEQIIEHCATIEHPATIISDERDEILETAGGIVKALPLIGSSPFVLLNADTFWIDLAVPNLIQMMTQFDVDEMDMLLLVCRGDQVSGHSGGLDFELDDQGRLSRFAGDTARGCIYAGAAIIHPRIFKDAPATPHSLNIYFDRAISAGRLCGHLLEDGHWFTVGTPQGLEEVEAKLAVFGENASSDG